ncbi:MAG: hypothetical protein P4M08_02570 [Oligoflexia bacterium]|nr:hypothetical protein [Oligoflexia bacterium]
MARYPKSSTPKLTEELIDKLAVVIRHGAYIETAAAFCGVHKDSLYRWLKMAASDEATELHHKLNDALKRAMAEAEVRDLSVINKAAQEGIWQAAAWRLERKHPERWGRQARLEVQHSGVEGQPIEITDRTETLKKILLDPTVLVAFETLEAKITEGAHDEERQRETEAELRDENTPLGEVETDAGSDG